jgi:hypothetical protein
MALAALLAMPSVGATEPTKADTKAASNECHDLIEASASKENFSSLTGFETFGECVSEKAREEAAERRAARHAAREACRDQQVTGQALSECVSVKAENKKAKKDARDQARIDGAETCAAEQEDAETFAETYGTKRNAFRKCVKEQT